LHEAALDFQFGEQGILQKRTNGGETTNLFYSIFSHGQRKSNSQEALLSLRKRSVRIASKVA
jgi:hypothetical protein